MGRIRRRHQRDAGRHQLGEGRDSAFGHLFESEHTAFGRADPGLDGAHQVTLRVRNLVRRERLVEMSMRLGECRQNDPPATVERVCDDGRVNREIRTDGGDTTGREVHVDGPTAGVRHVADQVVGHGLILTRSPTRLGAS